MEETIKGKEVIAYKGMNSDMSCRDFKYELGKSYKTDKAELCNCGFHACLNPLNILYPRYSSSRYFKVKLSGEITKCGMWDTNIAATEITILEEISIKELRNITEWWKNDNVLDLLYFSDGLARVQRGDGLMNFINKDGKLLLDKWFEFIDDFKEGFARLQRTNGEYNFIDKQGKILSDEWFICVDNFHNGFAVVKRSDKKYNFIGKDGKFLSNEWFYWVDNFQDGFTKVQRGDELWNFIDKQGKFLSKEWFIYAYYLDDRLAVVQRTNGERCIFTKNGIIVEFSKKIETEMEEKIKQVEDIDTLKELNKNLISENEMLTKKNMKLSEKYQSTNKKNASLRTAIASIKGFENAEQLCAELNRLKQQNKSLSEANAKLIADAKGYLKTIDEQKKVISASEKSIGTINDKLKIITLSQQSMHKALKDSGEEKSELVKKYKEALSAKSVAEARQEELEKENIQLKDEKDLQLIEENVQLKEENIHLREHMMKVYTASLIQRIKYVFTKSI